MKNLVASLTALGLATAGLALSGPVLAAEAGQDTSMLKERLSQMEATLASLSQQDGRPEQLSSSWNKFIKVSGGANFDARVAGSLGSSDLTMHTSSRFTGVNNARFSINDAYLNFDADVNEWVSGRVGLTYTSFGVGGADGDNWYNSGRTNLDTGNPLHVDQAYVTLANLDKQPYYARAGLQYFDYGSYELHPITRSFTQVLTQINDVGIQLGMLDSEGWNASVFFLDTPYKKYDNDENIADNVNDRSALNFGGSLAYDHHRIKDIDLRAKVGYLSNFVGLDAYTRGRTETSTGNYSEAVHAFSAMIGAESGPFAANVSYAGALKSFSNGDMETTDFENAKPSAYDLNASYAFKYMDNRDNRLTVGYSRSYESSMIGLPKDRYYAEYTLGLYKNTDVSLRWDHDIDYSAANQTPGSTADARTYASGNNFNVVTARVAVNFG
jgi:hypothetical protein